VPDVQSPWTGLAISQKGLEREPLLRSPLLHFVLLGTLIYVVQSMRSYEPEVSIVEVRRSEIDERLESYRQQMGRAPTEPESRAIENQVIENAIWLEQAYALGLHQYDTVVHQRLLLNMRFLEGEDGPAPSAEDGGPSEADLIARAIELGMDRSDTVVQRRLIDRVQAILRGSVRARELKDQTLTDHYEATTEQWREPALLDLSHVYFSRDRRGASTTGDATSALTLLGTQDASVHEAISSGDPFLAGHRLRGASPNRIVARLGPAFAEGVAGAPVETWFGPVESAFGQHLVWIHERVQSRIPPLAEIRKRVVEDWIEIESRKTLREHVEKRRTQVQVRILEDGVAADANQAPVDGNQSPAT
jgi:hypothetical protein